MNVLLETTVVTKETTTYASTNTTKNIAISSIVLEFKTAEQCSEFIRTYETYEQGPFFETYRKAMILPS